MDGGTRSHRPPLATAQLTHFGMFRRAAHLGLAMIPAMERSVFRELTIAAVGGVTLLVVLLGLWLSVLVIFGD
jgi:hypothetical protein